MVSIVDTPSRFCRSALQSSLVSQAQFDDAVGRLRALVAVKGSPPTLAEPYVDPARLEDEQLAAILIEQKVLNPWQAEQLLIGRVKFALGPYRIVDSIGQGGMGQVFKAEHAIMGRTVAVKVLPKHRSSPGAIANFTKEIRTQAQLDHENLVRAYDAGHEGNVYYLVTEYVPGTDMRRFVRKHGKMTMRQAASILVQASRALSYAHSQGLIHRDVKPGNVLVSPGGRVKLSDLGLAGLVDEIRTKAGARIAGTADYLPPDQIHSPKELGPTSDIYSLGCTLYYAVTGKVPFPGGNTREKIKRHCKDTPINPRLFNPKLDDSFLGLLCDMMEKSPENRIQSADEVVSRLLAWADPAWRPPNEPPPKITWTPPRQTALQDSLSQTITDINSPKFDLDDSSLSHPDISTQGSQVTDRINAAVEETLRDSGYAEHNVVLRRRHRGWLSKPIMWIVGGIAVVAAALLVARLLGV